MKTDKKVSKKALTLAFADYADVKHLADDVVIVVKNTQRLYDKLISNRRTKELTLAYGGLFEIVAMNGELPKGYYVTTPQLNKYLVDRFGADYHTLFSNVIGNLEAIRNSYLGD